MKIKKTFFSIATLFLTLAALLATGGGVLAGVLQFSTMEIRDPMMNNVVAARVALPQGWVAKEQEARWNMKRYADPAQVIYTLQGPADEVEFSAVSRFTLNFDQSSLALADYLENETTRRIAQQCLSAKRFTPASAQMFCAQADANIQQARQKFQQDKAAILSGKMEDNGAIVWPPHWAADVAQWQLQHYPEMADVRVKKIERPADLEALLPQVVSEQDAKVRQRVAQLNMPATFKGLSFDMARVYFSYAKNNKRYDGIIMVVTRYLTFVHNQQTPGFSGQSGPDLMSGKEFVMWQVHINLATALAGRLEAHESELIAIVANSAVDPVWQMAVNKLAEEASLKITEQEQKTEAEMQKIRIDTLNYIQRIDRKTMAQLYDTQSKLHIAWTDTLTDRQRWQGGDDKYVVPNDYDYGWKGPDGKTVFTNNVSFDPNNTPGSSGDWAPMRKVLY